MLLYKPVGLVHKNVELMMAGHERLGRRDMDAIASMFAPTIVSHELGVMGPRTTYRGLASVMEYWNAYLEAGGANFHQDITSIMANDEFITTIVNIGGTKPGISYEEDVVDVLRVERDLITEIWRYYNSPEEAKAFFAAPAT